MIKQSFVTMASQLRASETKKVNNLEIEISKLSTKIETLLLQKEKLQSQFLEKTKFLEQTDEELAEYLQTKQKKAQERAILKKAAEISLIEEK